MLDPFISKNQLESWGISKPVGVILYGPPGSGKYIGPRKLPI